jgi:hypothetical protein
MKPSLKRWWMSWIVEENDYRPLTFPPNPAILGWWCTGEDAEGRNMLCGLVEATNLYRARQAVLKDWPGIAWRFVSRRENSYVISSDRFPLSDWMKKRMKTKGEKDE